jgi:catechol 2,3-dioxygenase-like lactoylglutathione lyase family enzyme
VTALLEVFDMPASVAFYRALGCEVVQHWGEREAEWDWVLLRLGNAELMLNTAYERDERPAAPDPGRARGHADAELYFDCEDLDAVCEQLRQNGVVVPEPESTFYGTRRVCLADPDGFRIWFQAPTDAE